MSASRADTTLDALLEFVKETRGFDFTRLQALDASSGGSPSGWRRSAPSGYDDYVDFLELHSEEFAELFNTLLINTTGFFRIPRRGITSPPRCLPQLLAARAPDSPLRVWCAGCASGEEPYTVAMVLARVMGDAGFPGAGEDLRHRRRRGGSRSGARHGAYLPRQIEDVPHGRRSSASSSAPISATCSARTCAVRDLRAQRSRPGRADLADRPARLPEHAHVLHRGDAGADPAALPLRARRRRVPAARQVRDADHPHRPVHPARAQAPGVPEGDQARRFGTACACWRPTARPASRRARPTICARRPSTSSAPRRSCSTTTAR